MGELDIDALRKTYSKPNVRPSAAIAQHHVLTLLDRVDALRREVERLAAPVAMAEIKTALATWIDDNDAAPPADVMGGVLDEFLAGRRGAGRD